MHPEPENKLSPEKAFKKKLATSEGEKEFIELRERFIIVRFLIEVHHIEALGRSENRTTLERRLRLRYGQLGALRARTRNEKLSAATISFLWEFFNADLFYIFTGYRRPELSGNMKGPVKLNVYAPYVYRYKAQPNADLLRIAQKIGADLGPFPLGPQLSASDEE